MQTTCVRFLVGVTTVAMLAGCGSLHDRSAASASKRAADRAEKAAVSSSGSGGAGGGGSSAKIVQTITNTKTYVDGVLVGGSVTWTCSGTTSSDIKSCREGADAGGSEGGNCSHTSTGASCTWPY